MGFLSGLRRGLHNIDPMQLALVQATVNGDTAAVAQIRAAQARQQHDQAEAEQEAQQLNSMRVAASQILGPDGQPALSKQQIMAMRPEDLSQVVALYAQPRQFGPEGGSLGTPGADGQMHYQQAPWQRQVGRSIISGGANGGAPQTVYEGIEPVSVQPGGGLYGVDGRGNARTLIDPAGAPSQPAPPAAGGPQPGAIVNGFRFRGGNPNDRNNWEAVGGAGGGAQRPFRASSGDLTILRNNNPGALRVPGSMQFQRFASAADGIQAQERQLGRYFGRGLNTISSIVETYAPRRSRGGDNTDEQVDNYIGHVSRRLGIDPHRPLTPSVISRLGRAMREFETGRR